MVAAFVGRHGGVRRPRLRRGVSTRMSRATTRVPIAIIAVTALVVAVFALQGCTQESGSESASDTAAETASGDSETSETSEDAEASSEETGTGSGETMGEEPVGFHVSEVEVVGDEIAVITTPKGVIKFEFYAEDAPNHVASFIELAEKGFYDGTKFHRVEPGFVIQGGDPLSKTDDPMVGTGSPGYTLEAEFNERPHLDGTVSMARAQDPDSAGSQFFICMGAQPFLDGQYTVFGQVVEGLDVVYQIEVGDPMESVTIERGGQ
jgi:peptidyl-prolyl cis-trans isomerase B (cyclophilin B)